MAIIEKEWKRLPHSKLDIKESQNNSIRTAIVTEKTSSTVIDMPSCVGTFLKTTGSQTFNHLIFILPPSDSKQCYNATILLLKLCYNAIIILLKLKIAVMDISIYILN
jgi:hypothetical protein